MTADVSVVVLLGRVARQNGMRRLPPLPTLRREVPESWPSNRIHDPENHHTDRKDLESSDHEPDHRCETNTAGENEQSDHE
jgi:hypothetical protein